MQRVKLLLWLAGFFTLAQPALSNAVIIAAGDSPEKNKANYICTGTADSGDDSVTIAQAIAEHGAGSYKLLKGTYWFYNKLIITIDGVEIVGENGGARFVMEDSFQGTGIRIREGGTADATNAGLIEINANNVKVKDLYMRQTTKHAGNAVKIFTTGNNTISNITIENLYSYRTAGIAFAFFPQDRGSVIQYVWLKNCKAYHAMMLTGINGGASGKIQRISVTDCIADNTGFDYGDAGYYLTGDYITFHNNYVLNWGGSGKESSSDGDGFQLGAGSNWCTIVNNKTENTQANAVFINRGCSHILIANNIFKNIQNQPKSWGAIWLDGETRNNSTDIVVTNNIVDNSRSAGIYCGASRTLITGNYLYNFGQDPSDVFKEIHQTGIILSGGADNCFINNNYLVDTNNAAKYGVIFHSGSDNNVLNNNYISLGAGAIDYVKDYGKGNVKRNNN